MYVVKFQLTRSELTRFNCTLLSYPPVCIIYGKFSLTRGHWGHHERNLCSRPILVHSNNLKLCGFCVLDVPWIKKGLSRYTLYRKERYFVKAINAKIILLDISCSTRMIFL